jgi:hypothetical protein
MHKRKFIVKVIHSFLALFSPAVVQAGISKEEGKTERVQMLTKEGKLVWVELKPSQKDKANTPISNQQLFSWIKTNPDESR